MPQMILHLTRSNRLWTFQLLGFELLQKKPLQLIISKFCVNMLYSILVNNRLYTPPNEGINWSLWPGFVKNLPSNGWFNYYSNNGIKHYLIKENHRLYSQ
jgi:hypothetical protein